MNNSELTKQAEQAMRHREAERQAEETRRVHDEKACKITLNKIAQLATELANSRSTAEARVPHYEQTTFATNGMISQLHKRGGSGDVFQDMDDMWGCDESLREGIQEASYSSDVFDLLRHIKNTRNVKDEAYIQLTKLIYDSVDNYIFRIAEDANK